MDRLNKFEPCESSGSLGKPQKAKPVRLAELEEQLKIEPERRRQELLLREMIDLSVKEWGKESALTQQYGRQLQGMMRRQMARLCLCLFLVPACLASGFMFFSEVSKDQITQSVLEQNLPLAFALMICMPVLTTWTVAAIGLGLAPGSAHPRQRFLFIAGLTANSATGLFFSIAIVQELGAQAGIQWLALDQIWRLAGSFCVYGYFLLPALVSLFYLVSTCRKEGRALEISARWAIPASAKMKQIAKPTANPNEVRSPEERSP